MRYKRKQAKQKKTKGVLMPKSKECEHRKYEKVNIHIADFNVLYYVL